MNLQEAIRVRHTIRKYDGKAIEGQQLEELTEWIRKVNEKGNLHFQLVNGQENALAPYKIRYGRWTGVTNYIVIAGKDTADLEQRCGYYGEQIMLWAFTADLKAGWVEASYTEQPGAFTLKADERFVMLMCIGYSEQEGSSHKMKSVEQLSETSGTVPEWFASGMEAARLAPTAGNQQLFKICWNDGRLTIRTDKGLLEGVDMGIAQYHFELGAGIDHSEWK